MASLGNPSLRTPVRNIPLKTYFSNVYVSIKIFFRLLIILIAVQLFIVYSILLLHSNPPLMNEDEGNYESLEDLRSCDLFDGTWIFDYTHPIYEASCPFIEPSFNCIENGRPYTDYVTLRWKPNDCTLPRINGKRMLEMLKGKRLAFVGDSLNRNMWESLACILRDSLVNKDQVFRLPTWNHYARNGFFAFNFIDYNCSIEYYKDLFLVQQWETLWLDLSADSAEHLRKADVIVFNTGHWWTDSNTNDGNDFYQEGNHVYSQLDELAAFVKAMNTWSKWVDASIDPNHTKVFFVGYSSSHYSSGGQLNSGGRCNHERFPFSNGSYSREYPKTMVALESVIKKMRTPVVYLNVTMMTGLRKDGHQSVYYKPKEMRRRGDAQDCTHWCLPGVPDAWNEILYAMLRMDAETSMKEPAKTDCCNTEEAEAIQNFFDEG